METMAKIEAFSAALEASGDLRSYAAKAALGELLPCWRDAVRDGTPLEALAVDIDLVIADLLRCKAALA